MSQLALNGTNISQSVKNSHVRYTYRIWDSCQTEDEDGYCVGGYDYYTGYSDAIIQGEVSCNNKVYANGVSVAKAGDDISETWDNNGVHSGYVSGSASPSLSGSGSGKINIPANTSNVYMNNSLVAIKNSAVTTHLNTSATLVSPVSSKIFIG